MRKFNSSEIFLIAGNIFPILGVLVWGWDPYLLVFAYWMESLIIGIYTILKMATVTLMGETSKKWLGVLCIHVFTIHYGAFMAIQLVIISLILGSGGKLVLSSADAYVLI